MSSSPTDSLNLADWPAFTVSPSGQILQANKSAVLLFGRSLKSKPGLDESIWASDNELTGEAFLKENEERPIPESLKFKVKGGAVSAFSCYTCPIEIEGESCVLFQLFEETDQKPQETTPPRQEPAVESKPPETRKEDAPPVVSSVMPGMQSNEYTRQNPDLLSMESSVAHKQKLDCALQLTRTVALDFNNALTSILGHTSLILSKMEPGHKWRNSLLEVEKSAEKAAEIAYDLAAFSQQEKDSREHSSGNINDILRRTLEIFRTPENEHIQWSIRLESKIYSAKFDEAKIMQAFAKVLDNAIQASESNGKIVVRTLNRSLDQNVQEESAQLKAGDYICVEIEDNGIGIEPDILPRIFEPFFTTKPNPPHRGLGLAWVYGIITNHGGCVAVESRPQDKTKVSIYLPAQKKIVRDDLLNDDDLRGDQTILLVDDEDLLLTMGETILNAYGYNVLSASNGKRALEIFQSSSIPIDLVITDMVMPHMSGRELIEKLRKISSAVKIICSTGYVRRGVLEKEEGFLLKPFTSNELLRRVKQALE